jgi:hypothetical protein
LPGSCHVIKDVQAKGEKHDIVAVIGCYHSSVTALSSEQVDMQT